MTLMALFHVIIPAAGIGHRMANVLPKQYLTLAGKPIISHVIQVFFNNPLIAGIHLALSPEDNFWRSLTVNPDSRLHLHYTGGANRSETVLNTMQAMEVNKKDWILVHDAARPGLSAKLLDTLLSTLDSDEVGGLLAMPVADTVKKSDETNQVESTISRQNLWQAQTPQMFRYDTLKQALSSFEGMPTDEAEAIEALGLKPKLVQGELANLKVTYPEDLALLEMVFDKKKEND
jgi:2-C-methyl-D-erythritol 4-phosphate cytidylyltransferase